MPVSVSGGGDIGLVLGYTLLLEKIERIGDQAKNIFDDGRTSSTSDDRSGDESNALTGGAAGSGTLLA